MPLPKLRPLDAYPVRVDGRDLVCLRDLEGIVPDPVLLPPRTFLIASLLDGASDAVDVQAEYARRTGGELLFSWDLQRVIDELDRHGLLLTERFAERRRAVIEAYNAAPERPPFHAGKSYPADPRALVEELDRHLGAVVPAELAGVRPRGVVAPHIDLPRGGWCYAWAHRALAQDPPETVVVLGVAHGGAPVPFVLTAKPYATPLGPVRVDEAAVAFLSDRLDGLLHYEEAHRAEHSIEFQALFLRHLYGEAVGIVPLLCALPGAAARPPDETDGLVEALRAYRGGGRKVALLASVDFSHVGPRFGDGEPVDAALAARTSVRDREVLERVLAGDAEGFWQAVMEDGNRQRIDAALPVYVLLRVLAPTRGRLLRYGQAPDPAGGLVSFASIVLE
ncbi:MAG: AmmeMemoRadiSam system protein B [Armatimonadota bacterium]|nr:AmmeMemoRadiSam system protein B [Armatimonadota bacterium]